MGKQLLKTFLHYFHSLVGLTNQLLNLRLGEVDPLTSNKLVYTVHIHGIILSPLLVEQLDHQQSQNMLEYDDPTKAVGRCTSL